MRIFSSVVGTAACFLAVSISYYHHCRIEEILQYAEITQCIDDLLQAPKAKIPMEHSSIMR